jgi:hypothetical protein
MNISRLPGHEAPVPVRHTTASAYEYYTPRSTTPLQYIKVVHLGALIVKHLK